MDTPGPSLQGNMGKWRCPEPWVLVLAPQLKAERLWANHSLPLVLPLSSPRHRVNSRQSCMLAMHRERGWFRMAGRA